MKESTARRADLIRDIISGKVDPVKDEAAEIDLIWAAMMALGTGVYESDAVRFFLPKDYYACTAEERAEAEGKANALTTLQQMLVILHHSMTVSNEIIGYRMEYKKDVGSALQKGYEALKPYGWYFENEDEKAVLDGTHESYEKQEEKK